MRVIVTGAAGFIGARFCQALLDASIKTVGCVMSADESASLPAGVVPYVAGGITGETDWEPVLQKEDVIVHLAARVHVMRESAVDPLAEFRKVNTAATVNLARQAAAAGAKRFVFMSTVGVNGNDSGNDAYTETATPQPHNDYSLSKYEAEHQLLALSRETGMEVVILRAPLVYGPGNPGNFLTLLKIVSRGIPLPLKSVQNVKSFLYVGNLVSALQVCCVHPAAAGETLLVSDSEYISTPELLRKLATALGRPSRLFPFPLKLLKIGARLAGKSAALERLTASLAIDSSKIRKHLGWTPPFTLDEGIRKTADWYKSTYETPV